MSSAPFAVLCHGTDPEAWETARRAGIGASEIAMVLGESPWGGPLTLWERKARPVEAAELEESERMTWGKLLEGVIAQELARRVQVGIQRNRSILRSKAWPWLLATPDGFTDHGEPIEVKNLHHIRPDEWADDGIPRHYYIQTQQQLAVTGAPRALFGALIGGQRLVWTWIERDEALIQRIVEAGGLFWGKVEAGTPPEVSDGSSEDRAALSRYQIQGIEVELADEQAAPLLAELAELEAAEKEARERADNLERARRAAQDRLALLLGDASSGHTSSGWRVRWSSYERKPYEVKAATVTQLRISPPPKPTAPKKRTTKKETPTA